MARRTLPVRAHGPLRPTVDGAQLLLAHVVSPAAAVNTLRATHGGQRQERAVNGVGVEVVVDAGAHDDLGAALRVRGVLRELAADADAGLSGDAGELLLPGWGADLRGIVEVFGPGTREIELFAVDAIVGEQHVEDGGHELTVDLADRDATVDNACADRLIGAHIARVSIEVEAREEHLGGGVGVGLRDGHDRIGVVQRQVPLGGFHVPAVCHRAAGVDDLAVFFHDERAVGSIGGAVEGGIGKLGCSEELAWGVRAIPAVLESEEER